MYLTMNSYGYCEIQFVLIHANDKESNYLKKDAELRQIMHDIQ